jgi:hypothetical protein
LLIAIPTLPPDSTMSRSCKNDDADIDIEAFQMSKFTSRKLEWVENHIDQAFAYSPNG